MRARLPDHSGWVDRDGVAIHYEVHGSGPTTVVLLPAWAIVHSRLWKAQVPYLAERFQVITYDPRGNGASDRPQDPTLHDPALLAGDAVAVLDAVGAQRAVLVGNSFGSVLAILLAALHPERVLGAMLIGTTLDLSDDGDHPLARAITSFEQPPSGDSGWSLYNHHVWERDFERFVRFFVGEAMSDPHSTKHVEDAVAWALETDGASLAATVRARGTSAPEERVARLRALVERVAAPTLVVHGTDDRIAPLHLGEALAEALGAPMVPLPGAGHCPQARYPVRLNNMIATFVERVVAGEAIDAESVLEAPVEHPSRPSTRRRPDGPRVLYLSSPIGLGHARRDLAIARELRSMVPDVRIDWLAQDPVTRFLAAVDEVVHPASRRLVSESTHLENEADEHDLHVFEAFRRMDEILVANFMTFLDVVRSDRYDLVVGDEAWEVDHFLHEEPTLKRARFAWFTDFVGYLPMPSGGRHEAVVAADYNAQMLGQIEAHPEVRDRSIFVGEPGDVVDLPFGEGLPGIRPWTEAHYDFTSYITGFDPTELADRDALREDLGYDTDQLVCIAAVGGSGVGLPLLRRMVEAHALARLAVPELRTVIVAGPRIEPSALPAAPGVEVRAFVPDLHRHLAACDLAVVQGGLTTTMELTATGRPFIYIPLRNHFEQQIHVRHRLDRHRAGRAMDWETATPEALAQAIISTIGTRPSYEPVPDDGARRAASLLVDLL